jgi:hypothetical protein
MNAQTTDILATPGAAMGVALALVAFLAVTAALLAVLWWRQRGARRGEDVGGLGVHG